MNIRTIKYHIAVAAVLTATAFCGCGSGEEDMIMLEKSDVYDVPAVPDSAASDERTPETIKVYVCGAVVRPDVYEITPDMRVIDAVKKAGGFTADAGSGYLNLAAGLSDGQKVYIPTNTEIEEAMAEGVGIYGTEVNITSDSPGIKHFGNGEEGSDGTGSGSAYGQDGKVNINQADRQTLMTLPGIGASKADKIIAYREANGGFSSIEDIMLVGGIKEGLFNKVKDSICVR